MAKKRKLKWHVDACCVRGCPATFVMYIGGSQYICWVHAIKISLKANQMPTVPKYKN